MSTRIKRAGLLSDRLCSYRAPQPLFIVGSEAAGVVTHSHGRHWVPVLTGPVLGKRILWERFSPCPQPLCSLCLLILRHCALTLPSLFKPCESVLHAQESRPCAWVSSSLRPTMGLGRGLWDLHGLERQSHFCHLPSPPL